MPPRMPSRGFSVLLRHLLAVGHRDLDLEIGALARHLGDGLSDHLARHGVDRRLADRDRQAGPRHLADAFAAPEGHAGAGLAAPHRGNDQRAMRDVGIVAGILDDAGHRRAVAQVRDCASAKPTRWPPGSVISTGSGNSPCTSAAQAALAAAVAQAPVVQPRLRGRSSSLISRSIRLRCRSKSSAKASRMSLEQAIGRLNYRQPELQPGHVWLVGAGPGDPGCLTLDALSALSQADALVHDALVSDEIIAVADAGREILCRQARRPPVDPAGRDQRAAGRAGEGRPQGACG